MKLVQKLLRSNMDKKILQTDGPTSYRRTGGWTDKLTPIYISKDSFGGILTKELLILSLVLVRSVTCLHIKF